MKRAVVVGAGIVGLSTALYLQKKERHGTRVDPLPPGEGTSYGNAFNFTYSMDLPVDDTTYEVAFDDWFFGMSEDTMMNRSYIKKFGITMAEVTIFMQKQ